MSALKNETVKAADPQSLQTHKEILAYLRSAKQHIKLCKKDGCCCRELVKEMTY